MSNIVVKMFEGKELRAFLIGEDVWFVAKDVCDILELSNMHSSIALLDEDEKGIHTVDTVKGSQKAVIISESGLYSLVFKSRKDEAKKFKKWVTKDVLPTIRKTGSYNTKKINEPMKSFTERDKQIELAKDVNAIIYKGGDVKNSAEFSKFWNGLHKIVTGMTAQEIRDFYNSKGSAKEILRKHAPHLEATEAVIEALWKRGVGLEKVKQENLQEYLSITFQKMLKLGIDPYELD